jgi:hypothetical protein
LPGRELNAALIARQLVLGVHQRRTATPAKIASTTPNGWRIDAARSRTRRSAPRRRRRSSRGLVRAQGITSEEWSRRRVMAKDSEWGDYFRKRLAEAAKELADFKSAIAKYKLRVFEHDTRGERDVTGKHLRHLESTVEEYRTMLRE